MNLFIKTLIKFGALFGLVLLGQFLFFYMTFRIFVDLDIDKNKSILILGDSNLRTDLNDKIVEGSINLSNGAEVTFFEYVKLKRLKEMNPQIDTLILGFNWESIYSNDFFHLSVMETRFQNYFYLMDLEDYKDLIINNIEVFIRPSIGMVKNYQKLPWIYKKNNIQGLDLGGFLPRPNNYSELESSIERETRKEAKFAYLDEFSQLQVKYFLKMVSFCKDNKIKLIVLNGPIHSRISNIRETKKNNFLMFLKKIEGDIEYWDYENYSFPDELFFDYNHLKEKGANIFSKAVNNKLKDSFSKSKN